MRPVTLRRLLLATTTLVLLIHPATARAQDAGDDADEPDRWGAEAALSFNGSGGNESLTVITTELGLTHLETASYELSFDSRFRYGRSEGREVANNVRGSLNADFWPDRGWSPFVFVTAERDPIRKLDARLNGGVGVKRTFYQNDWDEVSLSGAVLGSYENTRPDNALLDDDTYTLRWSWRGRGRYQVREGTRLEQTVFFQPAWDEFDDYLVEVQSSARVALTRTLAVTASALYERDSTPAPDVGPDDWSVSIGLSLATVW